MAPIALISLHEGILVYLYIFVTVCGKYLGVWDVNIDTPNTKWSDQTLPYSIPEKESAQINLIQKL